MPLFEGDKYFNVKVIANFQHWLVISYSQSIAASQLQLQLINFDLILLTGEQFGAFLEYG